MTTLEMKKSSLHTETHGLDAMMFARPRILAAVVCAAVSAVALLSAILEKPAVASGTPVSTAAQSHAIEANRRQFLVRTIDWNRMTDEADPSPTAVAAYER